MARRTFHEDAVSRQAAWSYRLALFALVVAALAIVVVRSGALEVVPALTTFAAALAFALVAVLLAFGGFIVIWRQGLAGFGRAVSGLLLGLALLAYPAYLGYVAMGLPAIADVSTDPVNPPRFETLAAVRPPSTGNVAATATLQREAYPEISPLQLSVMPRVAYEVSLAVINKHRWTVANARPPTPNRRDAVIEATARTLVMGFRDDVVIRITPLGQGARVDLRSASRFGRHDFGANAARLRGLLEEIEAAADAAPEPRPEPEKVDKPAPKRPAPKKPPAKQPEKRR